MVMIEGTHKTHSFYRYFPLSERDRRWGLYVTTTGETRIGPHEPYPPPGHPKGYDFEWSRGRVLGDHQVVYISHGRGWFESRQCARQRLEAGTVFLLFPGVWHRYTPDRQVGWEEHWVGFSGDMARRWIKHGFFSPQSPILRPTHEDLLLTLFTRMVEAIKTNQPALQQVLAGIVTQIMGLLYSTQQARLSGQAESHSAIHQAIERMQNDFCAEVDLPALARQLNVSYSWLRRNFAQHTGLSPHQYLLELRLVRARNLLSDTPASVKEIATRVGFEDEHYFCRLFRRKTGVTPSHWRTRANRVGRNR